MGRPSIPSNTLLRAIRTHFGLTLEALASYCRVSVGLLSHCEAGRRTLSTPVLLRLGPLAAHLPAPEAAAASAQDPAALLAPPAPAPLAARLDYCQHHATRLRRELAALEVQLEYARRWQAALPALLAQAADERARAWLLRRQAQAAADLDADTAARYHLLRLRAEALEAEATGLAALLGVH
jgi:transcriptional regulator with XRE-family HTH domain